MADKKKAVGAVAMSKEQMAKSKLLILHGWSYSTDKWAPFMKLLEAKGLTPQLLEIPGLTAPIDQPWTLDDYVEWLKDQVGKGKVILLGHSNGGRISLAFTLKHPDLVERLILIDSAGIYHNEFPIRLKRFIFRNLAKTGKKLTTSEIVRNIFHKLAQVSDYRDAAPKMRETMINLTSVDLTSDLHKIAAPTLIIWGARDKTTPLSDGELMYKLIPNSRIYVIRGARHSPQFTHPEEVYDKIIEWINGGF